MGSLTAEELFRPGIPESKKFELIYRQGPSLSPDDLRSTVNRLRADCRYARLLGALIDASRNEELAIEELFSENAVSSKIVAKLKWLYAHENKGFISEDFVKNTLPSVSLSGQRQILNRISKYLTNTDLGDKLWHVANEISSLHSSMLLGACSNDRIMEELRKNAHCISTAQLLDILRKRFDSGVELIKWMAEEEKIIERKILLYILKQNFERGIEVLITTENSVRLGHHSTRSLLELVSRNEAHLSTLLSMVEKATQRVLARKAPADVYSKCFCARFKYQETSKMLKWLKHLRDDGKQKTLEAWYENVLGSNMIDSYTKVPEEFLFPLDEKTLREIVTRRIALASRPDDYSDKDVQFWESMIPDDEESFNKQKEHLKAKSSPKAKAGVYENMFKSVIILKRPQYLGRRLAFLVETASNHCGVGDISLNRLETYLRQEHRFTITEEIWPHLKELSKFCERDRNKMQNCCDILLAGLERTSFERESLLAAVVEELNRLQMTKNTNCSYEILSEAKREFFWRNALAYRETIEDTTIAANGDDFPGHLYGFYSSLANDRKVTRKLIEDYPKTMQILKLIVGPSASFKQGPTLDFYFVRRVHKLLEPLLPPGTALRQDLIEEIQKEERETRKTDVLRTFKKSKIITEELRAIYTEECYSARTVRYRHEQYLPGKKYPQVIEVEVKRRSRDFVLLCGRSLIHADAEQFSKWLTMLDEYIKENETQKGVANTYRLKAMISSPSELKEEVVSLYPTSAKFDIWKGNSESRDAFKRINLVKSLRYFNESGLALEMTRHFMKGDYLKETFASFRHHLCRLPVAKLISLLRESILQKNSPVSARKAVVRGLLVDVLVFCRSDIQDILQQLSVKEEHDNIKEAVLSATFNFVKQVGEEKGWPMLKQILDSILIGDRGCISLLLHEDSIDAYIPKNLNYFMDKVVNFGESDAYVKELDYLLWPRLNWNAEMLGLDFLLRTLEKMKKFDWETRYITDFAMSIILYHAPRHAEVMRSHFFTFGNTMFLDRKNSTALTERIVRECINEPIEKSSEAFDFLLSVFEARTRNDLREICLLKTSKQILPLLPGENIGTRFHRKRMFLEATLAAIRIMTGFLEEFGMVLFHPLIHNLHILVGTYRPYGSEWLREAFDREMSPMEFVILLTFVDVKNIFDIKKLEEADIAKLEEIFLKSSDERIRAAIREKIFC